MKEAPCKNEPSLSLREKTCLEELLKRFSFVYHVIVFEVRVKEEEMILAQIGWRSFGIFGSEESRAALLQRRHQLLGFFLRPAMFGVDVNQTSVSFVPPGEKFVCSRIKRIE